MEKPKFHLNPNEEIVKTIREGLKRTGGYCPCRLQHIPENICICSEFKQQLADPDYHGPCHCGLYVPKLIKIGRHPSAAGGCLPICLCSGVTRRPSGCPASG